MRVEGIFEQGLAGFGGVDQGAVVFCEEIDAIGAELAVGEGMGDLELGFDVVEGGANFVELDLVVFADGAEDVDFNQIGEGEEAGLLVWGGDEGLEVLAALGGFVAAACDPRSDCPRWNAEVAGGFTDGVGGDRSWIDSTVEVRHGCSLARLGWLFCHTAIICY